jgi:hypothetical protein
MILKKSVSFTEVFSAVITFERKFDFCSAMVTLWHKLVVRLFSISFFWFPSFHFCLESIRNFCKKPRGVGSILACFHA